MSRYGRDAGLDCKIYVGDLARDATEKDLERSFSHYGPLRSVWVARNPPGFAFVEFEDHRDADDAVRSLDGTSIVGSRVRVEHSSGKIRPKPWNRRGPPRGGGGGRYGGDSGGRKPFNTNDRCYECGEHGHYAYDCPRSRRGGGGGSSRKRSRSRSRSYERRRSYTRSRSRSRGRDRNRSVSRSPPRKYSRSRSKSVNSRNGGD